VCDPYPEEDPMNVEISGVNRRFGRNLAVAGVDVETGPGVFGLGPNGVGKSAAKRVISGEKEGVA
jgi:ABC-2 type transport system ATP-binding protein